MGPVPFAPLVEDRHNRGNLLAEQAVHRDPAGLAVGQVGAPGLPAFDPPPADPEHLAHGLQGPARTDRLVDQGEEARLADGVDPAWDGVGHRHPEPPFPSSKVSLTASSFTASDNRATSAFAASNSTSRAVFPTPGFDADNADMAPSLATWRSFITVDRSTPATSAAWLIVVSPRTSWRKISYFTDGANNFFARRVDTAGTAGTPLFALVMDTHSRVSQTPTVWSDQNPEMRHDP
jgi:hypothetical protein